jgi:SSS family solute:Na+ symporter
MAQNFWTAIVAWSVCFVATIIISLATRRTRTDEELKGLVFALTERPKEEGEPLWKRPKVLAIVVLSAALVLNLVFK